MGRITILVGCLFAVLMSIAIDNIKGHNLFDIFQAVLGFIAPPLAVVFLLAVFWKKTTRKAVNFALSWGAVISLGVGALYLWVFPKDEYDFWPHYLLLSFYIFALLFLITMLISVTDKNPVRFDVQTKAKVEKPTRRVKIVWAALIIVMISLYLIFH